MGVEHERGEVHTGVLGSKLRGRDYFEDVSIDGRIILKCILKISVRGRRFVSCCSGYGPEPDSCECGDELSVCRKGGEFVD
jgi:hypothetical protein